MDIDAFFRRIGYDGPRTPGLATLRAVQRAYALAVPYETFDIFLGRPIPTAPEAAWEKIVGQGRGGWCYEKNGVLGLALQALGFEVSRLTVEGEDPATHLALKVEAPGEGAFICDPGFGDAPLYPFALKDGPFEQNGFSYGLEVLDEGRFRLINHPHGALPGYTACPADETAMAAASHRLQTAPDSRFILVPVACIHEPDGAVKMLAGRTLRTVRPGGVASELVETVEDYVQVLRTTFNLRLPEAHDLWPEVERQHEAYQRRRAEALAKAQASAAQA